MFLSSTMAFAVIGPIPVDETNVYAIPNGNLYGTVTVTQTTPDCVQIVADVNQTILVPLPNFGIQAFGFNFLGAPTCLKVTYLPTGWEDKTSKKMDGLDGFGKFIEEVDTTGSYRQDPLVLTVCSTCGDLAESDVIVTNGQGDDTFAMHIADFKYDGTEYQGITSAFFATDASTTTTVQPTTTTTEKPTATTTVLPTTTTTGIPTAVTVASFEANPGSSSVKLIWVTGDETDNLGFNIFRADSKDGEYVKINASLIPSKVGSGLGTSYEFTDSDVKNRKAYYYKLEDVDVNGVKTMHGPVSAVPRLIFGIFVK